MSEDSYLVKQILINALKQVNVFDTDYGNIAEKLDSLHRLEVISVCESVFSMDFTEVLIEPENWISIDTLTQALIIERTKLHE